jgi:hypothetical protein
VWLSGRSAREAKTVALPEIIRQVKTPAYILTGREQAFKEGSKRMPKSTRTLFLLYHILCGIGKSANYIKYSRQTTMAQAIALNLGRKRGER